MGKKKGGGSLCGSGFGKGGVIDEQNGENYSSVFTPYLVRLKGGEFV